MAGLGRAGVGWDIRESMVGSTLTGALFVFGGLSVPPALPSCLGPSDLQVIKCLCVRTLFFVHFSIGIY